MVPEIMPENLGIALINRVLGFFSYYKLCISKKKNPDQVFSNCDSAAGRSPQGSGTGESRLCVWWNWGAISFLHSHSWVHPPSGGCEHRKRTYRGREHMILSPWQLKEYSIRFIQKSILISNAEGKGPLWCDTVRRSSYLLPNAIEKKHKTKNNNKK